MLMAIVIAGTLWPMEISIDAIETVRFVDLLLDDQATRSCHNRAAEVHGIY